MKRLTISAVGLGLVAGITMGGMTGNPLGASAQPTHPPGRRRARAGKGPEIKARGDSHVGRSEPGTPSGKWTRGHEDRS